MQDSQSGRGGENKQTGLTDRMKRSILGRMDDRYNLTVHPPRAGSVALGGWGWLPRMIDKARATYHGNPGSFAHPCSRDRVLLSQLGMSTEEFREIIEQTSSDEAVLAEIEAFRDRKATA